MDPFDDRETISAPVEGASGSARYQSGRGSAVTVFRTVGASPGTPEGTVASTS